MTTSAISGRRICSRNSEPAGSIPTSRATRIIISSTSLKAIGFAEWNDVKRIPCHTWIEKADKYVMQYPPGTGFALALFPAGFQVIPLYALASVTIFGFALLGLFRARAPASLALAALFGFAALYLMINPTKASYSMAPTMMVCAAAGYLTARLFDAGARHRLVLIALVGLLIGLSVNFRLPNLFLSAGYFLFLAGSFLWREPGKRSLQGVAFGVAFLIGIAPTLIANAINAGSPFSTTYGGVDVVAPELNSGVLWRYFVDVQFTLLAVAAAWTVWLWRGKSPERKTGRARGRRQSGREPDLLPVPSDLHALLYYPDRHALALDSAIRNARPSQCDSRG